MKGNKTMNDSFKIDEKVTKDTYNRLKPLFYMSGVKDIHKLNTLLLQFSRNQGELVYLGKYLDENGPIDKKTGGVSTSLILYIGTLFMGGKFLLEIAKEVTMDDLFDTDRFIERILRNEKD